MEDEELFFLEKRQKELEEMIKEKKQNTAKIVKVGKTKDDIQNYGIRINNKIIKKSTNYQYLKSLLDFCGNDVEKIQNNNYNKTLLIHSELIDMFENNEVKLVRLKHHSKIPMDLNWNFENFDKEHFVNHDGNLGMKICNGWAAIDIDGTKLNSSDLTTQQQDIIKQQSKEYIASILFKAFPKAIHVRTAGGGYHILLKSDMQYDDDHAVSKVFHFPDACPIKELREMPLNNAIEVFTRDNSRQIVLPESQIQSNKYEILDSGVQSFADVEEYNDINDIISKQLILNYFTESDVLYEGNEFGCLKIEDAIYESSIPKHHLDDFSDLLVKYLKHCDISNEKHRFTLALGGYFKNYKIKPESVEELGNIIISKLPQGFFKSNKEFIETLLKTYKREDKVENTQGGLSAYSFIEEIETKEAFFGKLIFYLGNNFQIYPTLRKGANYKKIVLDQRRHMISVCNCTTKIDDDGEDYEQENSYKSVFGANPIKIERVTNFANQNEPPRIIITYLDSLNHKINIEGEDLTEVVAKTKRYEDLVTSHQSALDTLSQVVHRFKEIGLIKTSDKSTIPGLFLNNKMDGLVRYDLDGNKVDIKQTNPTKALELLKKIGETYPTDPAKFAEICRMGLVFPLTKILKEVGILPSYMLLGGAGGTLKSTLSEMILNFYADTATFGKHINIFGGGAFSSEYQVGEKFGLSTYGFIVNEPAAAFVEPKLLEILKNSIESDLARKTKDRDYLSYQSAIFCTNVDIKLSDAISRRFTKVYFTAGDRPNQDDLKKIKTLLNVNGKNKRFKELRPIGDFCVNYINQNMDVLVESEDVNELSFKLVDEMEKVTGLDLGWLKLEETEETSNRVEEIADFDLEIFNNVLQYVRNCYNREYRVKDSERVYIDGIMDSPTDACFEENKLKNLIKRGAFSFVQPFNKETCFIPTGIMKKFYQKEFDSLYVATEFIREILANLTQDYDNLDKKSLEGRGSTKQNKGTRPSGIKIPYGLLVDFLNYKHLTEE